MPALADIVLTAQNKDALVADCVQLTEGRIAARGGLRGIAMKTSLSLLKAARPDILPRAMLALLPDFVGALDPLYQDFVAAPAPGPQDFASFLQRRSDAAVGALLQVTDDRAARVQNAAVKSVYARLRGGAENEVEAALPDFARLLSNYLPRPAR
ncbi:MAG: hypothetical protein JWR07_2152 [Nevskia sp.]|nr:hypothetical protein [Nevskia sp.]